MALVFWFSSLAPETGPDATGGRSAVPLIWGRLGHITAIREIGTSYMGIGGEILNLIALPLAGENMAKVTTLVSAFLLAAGICGVSIGQRRVLPWLACFVFFSSTVVWWQFVHGFVDLHVTLLTVASLLAFERWIADRRAGWLIAAGVIAGSAVAIKLHAGTMLVVLVLVTGYECGLHRGRIGATWKPLTLLLVAIGIGLVPSIIRTYLLTHNPVFPFANSFFSSPLAEVDLAKRLPSYGTGFSMEVFGLPFRTQLTPSKFNELGTYHPAYWLLALFSVGLLFRRASSASRWWLATMAFWAGWIITEHNLRYSIPALACTTVAIASTGRALSAAWNPAWWTAVGVILAGTFLGISRPTAWIWNGSANQAFPRNYLLGKQTADQFQALHLPSAILAKKVNAEYGAKAVVWQVPFFRDHQSFLGRAISHPHSDLALRTPLYSILPGESKATSYESIYQTLLSSGITHVMWDTTSWWIQGRPESSWSGIYSSGFAEKYLVLDGAYAGDNIVRLYRVRSEKEISTGPIKNTSESLPVGEFTISGGAVVGVQAKWVGKLPADPYFDIVCWSADHRMLFWSREYLVFTKPTDAGWHRRWQTIPAGTTTMQVSRSTEMDSVELTLLRAGK